MIFNTHHSRLDQYLPALLRAAEIKKNGCQLTAEQTRAQFDELLNPSSGEGRSQGRGQPAADDAFFAVCAFIDEALLNSPWPERGQWLTQSLARDYFKTAQGGHEFFKRLSDLMKFGSKTQAEPNLAAISPAASALPEPEAGPAPRRQPPQSYQPIRSFLRRQALRLKDEWREVLDPLQEAAYLAQTQKPARDRRHFDPWRESLEVFAAVLELGFTGRYYGPEGREHLDSIKRNLAAALAQGLPAEAGSWPDLSGLSPAKPSGQTAGRLLTALLYLGPLLLTLALLALQRHGLTSFTEDWARALGLIP